MQISTNCVGLIFLDTRKMFQVKTNVSYNLGWSSLSRWQSKEVPRIQGHCAWALCKFSVLLSCPLWQVVIQGLRASQINFKCIIINSLLCVIYQSLFYRQKYEKIVLLMDPCKNVVNLITIFHLNNSCEKYYGNFRISNITFSLNPERKLSSCIT